jgi:hypothetical protein
MQSDEPSSHHATPEDFEEQQAFEQMLKMLALNKLPVPPNAREAFRASRAERAARPQMRDLDADTLRSISPVDLDRMLSEYVVQLLSRASDRPSELAKLPRGVQVFYLTYLVEAEVVNGGFHQFFWNSSSEFAELVASAISELGDPDAARIYESALAQAISEMSRSVDSTEEIRESFARSASQSTLHQFDDSFAQRARHFSTLRLKLVRGREQLFLA